MLTESLIQNLQSSEEYFNRSSSCLTEEHSSFRPKPDTMTVAQQVAHVAQTLDWFIDGAFGANGFDLDFEAHAAEIGAVDSLAAARARLAAAFARACDTLGSHTDEELQQALPEGPVMGGVPRAAIVPGMQEHTAHHRGVLSVYSRLLDLTPSMPYM